MVNFYKHFIITLICLFTTVALQAQVCCPAFKLTSNPTISSCDKSPQGGGTTVAPKRGIPACKQSVASYFVTPNLPGFTYTWQVTSGAPTAFIGNPFIITWDTVSLATLTCYITDATGSCKDTITELIALEDKPLASFTTTPNTNVCPTVPITFNSTSVGGNSYTWDFGDGTGTAGASVVHSYTAAGTYTVTLLVETLTFQEKCGCTDTQTAVITVNAGTVPTITSTCKQMLCPGDTASYCVTPLCPPYNWTVNGGTIVGSNTNDCVKILWNNPPINYPPSVTVLAGNCAGQCSNTATLPIPVLYNNIPIIGKTVVCASSSETYTIMSIPGTFYKWTNSGGIFFTSPDSNATTISIFTGPGVGTTHTITCMYNNPITGCSGISNIVITKQPAFKIGFTAPYCVGSSGFAITQDGSNANFTITNSLGYIPTSTFNNTSNITNTWVLPGSYDIAASPIISTNYCTPNDVFGVTVNDTPTLAVITGPTTACPGVNGQYNISSNINGGTFYWAVSAGGTIVSQMGTHNDSIIVNWTAPNNDSITVYQIVNGCISSIQTIYIGNLAPPVLASGTTFGCVDQNFPYTAVNSFPAGSYTWSIKPVNGGTIINGQGSDSINIQWHGSTLAPTTTNTVYVTTCSGVDSIIVTVGTPPPVVINSIGNLCSGQTLTASITGVAYQWYVNNVPIPSSNTQSIIINAGGMYKVEVFQVIGGCASKASINVLPVTYPGLLIPCGSGDIYNLPPDTTVLRYCIGVPLSVPLNIINGGGWSIQWYRNNFATPVGTGISYTATNFGTYFLTASNGLGCVDTIGYIKIDTICCTPTYTIAITDAGCDVKNFYDTITPTPTTNFPIRWCFGDGASTVETVDSTTHKYEFAGQYNVCAYTKVLIGADTCAVFNCKLVDVNLVAKFDTTIVCGAVNLFDQSTFFGAAYAGYTTTWAATGPGPITFTPSINAANTTMNVTVAGVYNVTLTISKNGCVSTIGQALFVPYANVSITSPNVICAGTQAPFSATPFFTTSTYAWNFGDNATSFIANTNHSYPAPPPNAYVVTLTTEDQFGCKDTAIKNVTVINAPPLTITPDQNICLGDSALLVVTPGVFTTFNWFRNTAPFTAPNNDSIYTPQQGAYYVIGTALNGGCKLTSPVTNVYLNQLPGLDIKGPELNCLVAGNVNVQLYNNVFCATCAYNWTAQGSAISLSVTDTLNLSFTNTGAYSYVLEIIDFITGCVVIDTYCVVVGEAPNVIAFTGPTPFACSGNIATFAVIETPANTDYVYNWSTGSTDSFITTSVAGFYNVLVTNQSNGCNTNLSYFIQNAPNVALFPKGCDTLCDTIPLFIPLPIFGNFIGAYTITWFDNNNYGTPIGTGASLALNSISIGNHNISCIVSNGNCVDTTDVFNLFVKKCSATPLSFNSIILNATAQNKTALLSFKPEVTNNQCSKYLIQKSIDGTTFTTIHEVAATTASNYSFIEKEVQQPLAYYRIKGINAIDKFVYSNVQKVVFEGGAGIDIFPNPNSAAVLYINTYTDMHKQVYMNDAQGKIVLEQATHLQTLLVPTSQLPKGIYIVQVVMDNGKVHQQKIVLE